MPSVSEIIQAHQAEILARWTHEARKAASARGLDAPAFANLIPTYLASLGQSDSELGLFPSKRRELVESHVAARLRQGFDLAEVIHEFALLGRSISDSWAGAPPEGRPEAIDVGRLYTELQLASASVTRMFTDHLLQDEQTEKRYLRLLQALAHQGLGAGAVPLRERLREVLELVMDALGAQGAALTLFDGGGRRPVTAAIGLAEDRLDRYASSLDPATFIGQVAAQEQALRVTDVNTTHLTVTDALRHSGLHALIGVRLRTRRPELLVGVLMVGLSEARAFTGREARRLEALSEQLTLHLDNARLYEDLQAKVEALGRERGLREQFVSLLAHDLRGPLTAAKVNAQLLGRLAERPEVVREQARRIESSLGRAERMISDLLDASRLRAGERRALRRAPCALGALARDVIAELASVDGRRFELQLKEGVVGLWDAEELRRALWNLATNALKYGAPDRPVVVAVRQEGPWAVLSVHNEGNPLSAEEQAHLFQPFGRTRAAREGGAHGWGLGLTLVRGAAEAHGGTVGVDSSPERGTTFTLRLPLTAAASRAAPSAAAAPPA